MSLQSYQNNVARIRRELASLEKQLSDETKKEVDKTKKIHQIERSVTKSTSLSALRSKQQQTANLASDIARIQAKKADLGRRIAAKTADLHNNEQRVLREQERERKQREDAEKKRERERRDHERAITRELQEQRRLSREVQSGGESALAAARNIDFDVFISHASEDKDEFVGPLAEELTKLGFQVWYDDTALKVGDSLRRSIDHGRSRSRYGVVVLSDMFFRKNWPQYELDGMIAREVTGQKVLLPIWHKVSKDEVLAYSPTLADRVALNSSLSSVREIAAQLAEVLKED